ncbi:MAG: hypothetical protein ABS58_13760 [Mesorhizobium sp. SCN 65-20]|nr:MAG: hypothetical protein ABS58_13760 [Mesorhizobium sp. SCN 65-20]
MTTTSYEVRYEDFGDGFETWAIYQITKNEDTGASVSMHLKDTKTEESARDIADALLNAVSS